MVFKDLAMIIAAGGSGSRFSKTQNKLLTEYRGKTLLLYALETFLPVLPAKALIVAAPADLLDEMRSIVDRALPGNQIQGTIGGATRLASVANARKLVPPECRMTAIHDAARPLATVELLQELYQAADEFGGAIPGSTPVDTVKEIDSNGLICKNLVRSSLAMVATPQVFRLQEYRQSLQMLPQDVITGKREEKLLTDDAAFFTEAGFKVKVVISSDPNPKITYIQDI
jgi:2-C-methyl-D-erythritol 4-phosphate cytidylyltransferase